MVEKSELLGKGEKAAKVSTYVLVILSVLKGTAAVFSGSVALLAGTIDSFSDIFSSVAVWAGLKIAKKKLTRSLFSKLGGCSVLYYRDFSKYRKKSGT
jgi:divalent metal cation (Fe/Co/Zn/Cd) transporter